MTTPKQAIASVVESPPGGSAIPRQVQSDVQVSYLFLLTDQIKHAKETRDKWFRYFLTITGIPLGATATLLQIDPIRVAVKEPLLLIASLSLFFLVLGVLFLLVYIRQRSNYIYLSHKLKLAEDELVTGVFESEGLRSFIEKPLSRSQFNADYFTNWVYMFFNAVWSGILAGVVYRIATPTGSIAWQAITTGLAMLFVTVIQVLVRRTMLRDSEAMRYSHSSS